MELYWKFVALLGKFQEQIENRLWAERLKRFRRTLPGLTLYHFHVSRNCTRVRRALLDLGLDVALKDVLLDPKAHAELMQGGKRDLLPCLRYDDASGTHWMYESQDIIRYLTDRCAQAAQ